MRRVIFEYYIENKWHKHQGYFHQWGADSDWTFGIIEDEGGSIFTVLPEKIVFIDTIKKLNEKQNENNRPN